MKYKLIEESSSRDLNYYVNYYLDQGWELYGLTFTKNEMLCQAVVKRDIKPSRMSEGCF